MTFRFDTSSIAQNIEAMDNRTEIAIRAFADAAALKLQNDARDNAKWTDRTGHARQRLTCSAGKVTKGYRLTLSHGVDYGLWLELAHEKRFAIIEPTIRTTGATEVLPSFERFLERLGR